MMQEGPFTAYYCKFRFAVLEKEVYLLGLKLWVCLTSQILLISISR